MTPFRAHQGPLNWNEMSTFFKNLFGSKSSSVIYVHTDKGRYFTGDMVRIYIDTLSSDIFIFL